MELNAKGRLGLHYLESDRLKLVSFEVDGGRHSQSLGSREEIGKRMSQSQLSFRRDMHFELSELALLPGLLYRLRDVPAK